MALASEQACARDVGTAVTKLHLDCAGAGCTGKQLVTKTDTEDGCAGLVHGGLDVLDGSLHHGWVTGTVGDEETIVVLAGELGEVIVPGNLQNLDSPTYEASELIVFETHVDGDDTNRAARRVLERSRGIGRVELGLLDGNYFMLGGIPLFFF